MTSNQIYHGLNRRWSKRSTQLHRLGFHYTCIAAKLTEYLGESDGFEAIDHPQVKSTLRNASRDFPIAYFERNSPIYGRQIVLAALLHHTHNREWPTVLSQVLRTSNR